MGLGGTRPTRAALEAGARPERESLVSGVKPSVGRVVHYVSHGTPPREDGTQAFTSVCRTALVTEIGEDGWIGLCAINPTGLFFHSLADGGCQHDEGNLEGGGHWPGTWHWPERVEE